MLQPTYSVILLFTTYSVHTEESDQPFHIREISTYCLFTFMIYLLTAIGLLPGGSSTVHIYTQTIHRTTQNTQYIEKHNNLERVRAVPRLCGLYPGICLTTEEKARKNLSQGSRRVPAGTMTIHKYTIRISRNNNKNT